MDRATIARLYHQPFHDLLFSAQSRHRENFPERGIQLSTLMSIKTGGCPEDCAYCPQSAHHSTSIERHGLSPLSDVLKAAKAAQKNGATRFCLGAAWRQVKDGPEFDAVLEMVESVSALGLEVCCTLGLLSETQARRLKQAGLDFYNHNIDSSRSFYQRIIRTRGYDDRLRTIENVRKADLRVCTGGILGMGETDDDRIDFLFELLALRPESVTINALIPTRGTPLEARPPVQALELARVIATTRLILPRAMIRLSAGRTRLSDEGQVLCFLAGANSIFLGAKLLTAENPSLEADHELLRKSGIKPENPARRPQ